MGERPIAGSHTWWEPGLTKWDPERPRQIALVDGRVTGSASWDEVVAELLRVVAELADRDLLIEQLRAAYEYFRRCCEELGSMARKLSEDVAEQVAAAERRGAALATDDLNICDGCNVLPPWEHRCHGADRANVGGLDSGLGCECPQCRELDKLAALLRRSEEIESLFPGVIAAAEARGRASSYKDGLESAQAVAADWLEAQARTEEECDCDADQKAHEHAAYVLREVAGNLTTAELAAAIGRIEARGAALAVDRAIKLAEGMIKEIASLPEDADLPDWQLGLMDVLREFVRRLRGREHEEEHFEEHSPSQG